MKEHPGIPENITQDVSVEEELNKTVTTIQTMSEVVSSPSVSKSVKTVARKSTSTPVEIPEYTFYGLPAEDTDLTKISTVVEINGMCLNMSADKLSKIFDLHPFVYVEDCSKSLDLTQFLDSWPELPFDFNLEDFDDENMEIDIFNLIESSDAESRSMDDFVGDQTDVQTDLK